MKSIIEIFSNRELALIIWLLLFIFSFIFIPKIGKYVSGLLMAFFRKKIILVLLFGAIYTFLTICIFKYFGLWNESLIKATIIWYCFSAFPLLLKRISIKPQESWWHVIRDYLTAIAILEYIVNIFSFSLIVELIMVPILTAMAGVLLVADKNSLKDRLVINFLNSLLSIFGLVVLTYSFYMVITNFNDVANKNTLLDFLLPIGLTSFFAFFVFLIRLYVKYEENKIQHSFRNR